MSRLTSVLLGMVIAVQIPNALAQPPEDPPELSDSWVYDTTESDSESETPVFDEQLGTSCCSDLPCCWDWPDVYARVDALFLGRDNSCLDQVMVIDVNLNPGEDMLRSTGDLSPDVETGFRALLGYRINECTALEFSYFGVNDWNASTTVTGNNDLAIPGDLGLYSNDFFQADVMRLDYSSQLHSLELNAVRLCRTSCCEHGSPCGNGCSTLRALEVFGGFRYLRLNELFNINSTDFGEGTSDYNIRVRNNLYGGQIGARWQRRRGCLGWVLTGKSGIFCNDAWQSQSVSDYPPPFMLRTERGGGSRNVAFVGEANFVLTLDLSDCWTARGGYNLTWIEGVALGPDQLDFTMTPTSGTMLVNDGGLFLHGASVGLEARW